MTWLTKSELTFYHVGCKRDWPLRCVIRSWGVDRLRRVFVVAPNLAKMRGVLQCYSVTPKIPRKFHWSWLLHRILGCCCRMQLTGSPSTHMTHGPSSRSRYSRRGVNVLIWCIFHGASRLPPSDELQGVPWCPPGVSSWGAVGRPSTWWSSKVGSPLGGGG